jgi:hypothetical protein
MRHHGRGLMAASLVKTSTRGIFQARRPRRRLFAIRDDPQWLEQSLGAFAKWSETVKEALANLAEVCGSDAVFRSIRRATDDLPHSHARGTRPSSRDRDPIPDPQKPDEPVVAG